VALVTDAVASRIGRDDAGPGDASAPGAATQAPEEVIEGQLRAILETTQTSAGAVCFFDQHQELLRLAVEVGLSDEGCRRLRTVRRGAATTWDMPLHSLLNRRVYLIESAAKNRYVPPLVDDVAAVRAVACVPLLNASTPVGSLILVALAPRTFGERQIRLLEQPVRDLVASILDMRKRVVIAAPARSTRPSLSSTATSSPSSVQAAGPITPGPKIAPEGVGGSTSIQAAVDRARAELERLRARLGEAEATAVAERKRADGLEQQRQELDTALQQARAAEAALRADLAHASERQDVVAAEAASVRAAEAEGLSERLAELEATNETLRARATELDASAEALRTRVAELEASGHEERAAADERIAHLNAEAETRVAGAATESEARLATVIAECEGLRDRITELEATAHVAAATEDTRTTSAVAEAQAAAAEWQRRAESLEADLATTRASAGSHEELLAAVTHERDTWAAERAAWDTERAAARARVHELEQRVEEAVRHAAALEAQLASARAEDDKLRDGFAHLEALIQTGTESGDLPAAPPPATAPPTFEVVELDGSSAPGDDGGIGGLEVATLDVEEIGEPPASAAAPAPLAASAVPASGLVVVDADGFWTGMGPSGMAVHVLAPGPDTAAEVAAKNPARLIVNLAVPNALQTVADVRQAGLRVPCFACIVTPGQTRGVLVGRFDVTTRPIDPDALLALLEGVFSRGTRVVTAGADVDGLISVRQALARLGVSVSMAWDAKQANDLLAMVRPEVAVIDLELPPKDGVAVVARASLTQPPPLMVVIPKATDTSAAFQTAVAHAELARSAFPAKELLNKALSISLKIPRR
jgi:CheY-like chemotaxis protein/predicted  nucleic acid-binding Zn-ribbon protein